MRRAFPAAWGGALVLTIVAIMARDYPLVGHDFRYFIPRIIDTDLYMRINGPVVQWYTPSFGGGLPAFSNPQHLQFSIVQALTFLVNPWMAIILTTMVTATIGFAAMFRVCRDRLGLDPVAATLGALFFIGNGFYIEHITVGHLGFQLFPIAAVMLAALLEPVRIVAASATLALAIGLLLHHAGFYLLIVCGLGLALSLPIVFLYRPEAIAVRRLATIAVSGAVAAGVIASSRIAASLMLMRQVPREIADDYGISVAHGLAGFVAQLTGVMTLTPLFAVAGVDLARVSNALMKLTGASVRTGLWEVDVALSPVLLALLLVGAARVGFRWRSPRSRAEWTAIASFAILSWIVIESTLARGFIYPVIKSLPIISSLHVNHRVAGAFVMPLSLAGAMTASTWLARRSAAWSVALIAMTLIAPLSYLAIPAQSYLKTFDVSHALATYDAIRSGEQFPIEQLLPVDDADTFMAKASSLQTYEALFGYAGETFAVHTHAGPVRDVSDGAFNMTNPASLAFPSPGGPRPFDRIAESDRQNFDAFISRRPPAWPAPILIRVLNAVAAIMAFLCAILMVIGARQRVADDGR